MLIFVYDVWHEVEKGVVTWMIREKGWKDDVRSWKS
jgi:hypothetical protein